MSPQGPSVSNTNAAITGLLDMPDWQLHTVPAQVLSVIAMLEHALRGISCASLSTASVPLLSFDCQLV